MFIALLEVYRVVPSLMSLTIMSRSQVCQKHKLHFFLILKGGRGGRVILPRKATNLVSCSFAFECDLSCSCSIDSFIILNVLHWTHYQVVSSASKTMTIDSDSLTWSSLSSCFAVTVLAVCKSVLLLHSQAMLKLLVQSWGLNLQFLSALLPTPTACPAVPLPLDKFWCPTSW